MTAPASLKTIVVNGTELHYAAYGTGAPVVFVHGGVTDWRTWAMQIEPFAQHYHVVVYSLRYHYPNAWSGTGADYSTALHTQDLAALIGTLGLAPSHIVGSSFGADIALWLAHEHPELVRTLVLGEPGLESWLQQLRARDPAAQSLPPSTWDAAGRAVRQGDTDAGVRLFVGEVLGPLAFDSLPE